MQVKDIIKAQEICFMMDSNSCGYCKNCPLFDEDLQNTSNCQELLAKLTIDKLNELTTLLDDTVNHHYYDTLETLQEDNISLREKIERAMELLNA